MKLNYLVVRCECANDLMDSPCRVVIQEVGNGELKAPAEFLIKPVDSVFDWTASGLTEKDVKNCPAFVEVWPKIAEIFAKQKFIVSCADGRDIWVLYRALTKYGISFDPFNYVAAKALLRKSVDEVSYSFDYLTYKYFGEYAIYSDQTSFPMLWARLINKFLVDDESENIYDFASTHFIKVGRVAPNDMQPSLAKRDRSKVWAIATEGLEVKPDENNPFYGCTVVFTGKLEHYSRVEARKAVIMVGGKAPEKLTMDTDYLVVGTQDMRVVGEKGLSGKMKNAAKYREKGYPIEIITEADFEDMINL